MMALDFAPAMVSIIRIQAVLRYPAIIHKEDGYWVEFPDLSGCFTNGSTLEETMEMAREADIYRRDTRAVKKMLSIPAWLAKEAEENNVSLSKILQEALKAHLHVS